MDRFEVIILSLLLSCSLSAQVYYTPPDPTEGIFFAGKVLSSTEGKPQINLWSDDPSGMWYQDTSKSFIEISCGDYVCVGIKSDSTLWFWGHGEAGVAGQGDLVLLKAKRPTQIGTDTTWARVAVGNSAGFVIATKGNGTLWSWGDGASYQTGQGSTTDLGTPTQVGSATGWTDIAAGAAWAAGIESGKLMTWGSNGSYRTGQGTTTGSTTTPTQLGVATNWTKVSCGQIHGFAINSSGELWAWGDAGNNRLGNASTTDRPSPIQIGTDTDWALAAAGTNFSYAIKTNGTLYSAGANSVGQTGQGTFVGSTSTFTQIGTDTDWAFVKLASGTITYKDANLYAYVLKTTGEVYSCGSNFVGTIGHPESTVTLNTLTKVGNMSNVVTWGAGNGMVSLIRRN